MRLRAARKSLRTRLSNFDSLCLNDTEFQLLRERELDKDSMCWAVRHLSECRQCSGLAPELTAQEIKDALAGTSYGKTDFIEQTINYYFQTLTRK